MFNDERYHSIVIEVKVCHERRFKLRKNNQWRSPCCGIWIEALHVFGNVEVPMGMERLDRWYPEILAKWH